MRVELLIRLIRLCLSCLICLKQFVLWDPQCEDVKGYRRYCEKNSVNIECNNKMVRNNVGRRRTNRWFPKDRGQRENMYKVLCQSANMLASGVGPFTVLSGREGHHVRGRRVQPDTADKLRRTREHHPRYQRDRLTSVNG